MTKLAVLAGLVGVLAVAGLARAEPATEPEAATAESPRPASLAIEVELGLRTFRFAGRLRGRDGDAGSVQVNGRTRPDGFTLDGRIEHDGTVHGFRLNADIEAWGRRAISRWSVTDL